MVGARLDLGHATEWLDACPVCDGRRLIALPAPRRRIEDAQLDGIAHALGLQACGDCEFAFVSPRPDRALLESFYRRREASAYDAGPAAVSAQLAELDRVASLAAGSRVLDYGCGVGHLLALLRARGCDAAGYDLAPSAIEACRARGLAATADLTDLGEHSFDAIIMSHVFEHVHDPAEVLARCRALLAPRGTLCIEVPNVASLRARLSTPLARHWLGFDERFRAFPVHLSYFAPSTMRRMLARQGFVVRAMTTTGLGQLRPGRAGTVDREAPVVPRRRARLRGVARRALHALHLGENLLAVASSDEISPR